MLLQEATTTLAPATVRAAEGRRVRVAFAGDEAWAEMALPLPYRLVAGDCVLVIGQGDAYFVIGVLRTSGPAHLSFPGDLHLAAPYGSVTLAAGQGVTLRAPAVTLRAGRLETTACTVVQKCASACHWVRDLLQVRAGRARTRVEGTSIQRAERTWVQSVRETKIDGEKVLLG